ncbi:MAG: chromate transporter [Chloroflexi bacterium]|nr:chromate transporter [Chloroflexota bacterium]
MAGVLENELVTKRGALTRDEFLAAFGLGRIVPSGTFTALAVAFGYRFGGWPGTVTALTAMMVPALVSILALTMAYDTLRHTSIFGTVQAITLPGALVMIVTAALRLSNGAVRTKVEIGLAVTAFCCVAFLNVNPALLLVGGGLVGAVAMTLTGTEATAR